MDGQDTLAGQVKVAIVRCLRMPITPEEIEDDMPLFDEGLGLDSIDALELAMALQERFGVQIQDDPDENREIFASVKSLAAFVTANRAA